MDDSSTQLCNRIKEKCRDQHWFGSDMDSPATLQGYLGESGSGRFFWRDRQNHSYAIGRDTDLSNLPTVPSFEFRPLTELQLQNAELDGRTMAKQLINNLDMCERISYSL